MKLVSAQLVFMEQAQGPELLILTKHCENYLDPRANFAKPF